MLYVAELCIAPILVIKMARLLIIFHLLLIPGSDHRVQGDRCFRIPQGKVDVPRFVSQRFAGRIRGLYHDACSVQTRDLCLCGSRSQLETVRGAAHALHVRSPHRLCQLS